MPPSSDNRACCAPGLRRTSRWCGWPAAPGAPADASPARRCASASCASSQLRRSCMASGMGPRPRRSLLSTRACISEAALRVKVMATISSGPVHRGQQRQDAVGQQLGLAGSRRRLHQERARRVQRLGARGVVVGQAFLFRHLGVLVVQVQPQERQGVAVFQVVAAIGHVGPRPRRIRRPAPRSPRASAGGSRARTGRRNTCCPRPA